MTNRPLSVFVNNSVIGPSIRKPRGVFLPSDPNCQKCVISGLPIFSGKKNAPKILEICSSNRVIEGNVKEGSNFKA